MTIFTNLFQPAVVAATTSTPSPPLYRRRLTMENPPERAASFLTIQCRALLNL